MWFHPWNLSFDILRRRLQLFKAPHGRVNNSLAERAVVTMMRRVERLNYCGPLSHFWCSPYICEGEPIDGALHFEVHSGRVCCCSCERQTCHPGQYWKFPGALSLCTNLRNSKQIYWVKEPGAREEMPAALLLQYRLLQSHFLAGIFNYTACTHVCRLWTTQSALCLLLRVYWIALHTDTAEVKSKRAKIASEIHKRVTSFG